MHRSAHNGPRSGRVGCQAQHVGRSLRRIWFNIALFVSETGSVPRHSVNRGPAFKNVNQSEGMRFAPDFRNYVPGYMEEKA